MLNFFLFLSSFFSPFSFQGIALLTALHSCVFSHLPPRLPTSLCSSHKSHPQRWHFDDERSRLQRDRRRRSCPPPRKVTLWTLRGDYSRRPWCDRLFLPLLEEEEEEDEEKTECVVFFPPRRRQK